MGKRRKRGQELLDLPIDLASRIGVGALAQTVPDDRRRVDGPIEPDRAARRAILIGANEIPSPTVEAHAPEPPVATPSGRPAMMIGLEEAFAESVKPPAEPADDIVTAPTFTSVREAPAVGEMDLVVTPLPTLDDWHHFELALRRLPGVSALRTEYYRAGILKVRLHWANADRLASVVASVPGYRIGILGEDRTTVQIRVTRTA